MKLISLKSKLLLSTVLTCSFIVLTISLIELFQFRELEKARIQEEFLNFEKGAKQTIREAVWKYDWEMVKTILESQTSRRISFVEICDKTVPRCLQHGTRDRIPYLEYQTAILYAEGKSGDQMAIGDIYLQSHYETFMDHMFKDLPNLLFTNILSVFAIALILFYLFHRQVVQRLLALEQYTRKIDLQKIGSLDSPVKSSNEQRQDEIDLLADAVGSLIDKTKDELERRQTLEQQLNHAHKMEALGNLAGGIAHDFNNILAAILGFAEMSYLKSEPGSDIYNNLQKIISAGQRAKNLTSQILVFSRRDESSQEILTLAGVVDETLEMIRASLPTTIRIKTDLDTGLRIRGDANRLHQVIMNIATNGAQAIGERGGTLSISLKSVFLDQQEAEKLILQPGRYCRLEICDDGTGIPDEIQKRIFEPFFTTKKAGEGTGMGLAVVHGIVQNHGGTIIMTSKLETGTSFSIYLPQTEQSTVDIDTFTNIPRGNGQKIIMVDDELQVLDMGGSILIGLGYKVTSFNEPKAALAFLRQEKELDLVITDLTMPVMNGIELATACKTLHPDVPIILWTGYKDDIASESLKKNLINKILQKPFNIEYLAQAVNQLLENAKK